MGGYTYGDHEPTTPCPYCGTACRADFVDIGVGYQQCGPFHCDNCGASEIGAYDAERPLSEAETKCGWYKPGAEPGSSANVVNGKIVSHVQARAEYVEAFAGNPLWCVPGYVEEWWRKMREQHK
jgi:hypothetical protein